LLDIARGTPSCRAHRRRAQVGEHCVAVALGIDATGQKHALGRTDRSVLIWATEFLTHDAVARALTMLERPPAVEGLVATPEQAEAMVAAIRKQLCTAVLDPDVYVHDTWQLARVKGASIGNRDMTKFDGPARESFVWLVKRRPTRNVVGRSLLLGPRTKITERFTRVSATELFYQFTIEDDELYTQPWSGEFSLTGVILTALLGMAHAGASRREPAERSVRGCPAPRSRLRSLRTLRWVAELLGSARYASCLTVIPWGCTANECPADAAPDQPAKSWGSRINPPHALPRRRPRPSPLPHRAP